MNKEESLALLAQGHDAWNAWAANMIKDREALQAAGDWTARENKSAWNDATGAWQADAAANFSGHPFNNFVDFSGFVFPGEAMFGEATFKGDARFGEATFEGNAQFGKATYEGNAGFLQAVFGGFTAFDGARFEKAADFRAI